METKWVDRFEQSDAIIEREARALKKERTGCYRSQVQGAFDFCEHELKQEYPATTNLRATETCLEVAEERLFGAFGQYALEVQSNGQKTDGAKALAIAVFKCWLDVTKLQDRRAHQLRRFIVKAERFWTDNGFRSEIRRRKWAQNRIQAGFARVWNIRQPLVMFQHSLIIISCLQREIDFAFEIHLNLHLAAMRRGFNSYLFDLTPAELTEYRNRRQTVNELVKAITKPLMTEQNEADPLIEGIKSRVRTVAGLLEAKEQVKAQCSQDLKPFVENEFRFAIEELKENQ